MGKKKILIIDDDFDFLEATKVVLEAKGYEVLTAVNKEEGLVGIEQCHPDLIIMDVMLDKMSDGFDLSRKLKKDDRYKEIPIFMVTSIGKKTGFAFSTAAGDEAWLPVDDFVEKPIAPGELISRIEKLLSK